MHKPIHFRRCHVCGNLNELSEGRVERCEQCHKHLCQFFYFDDRFTEATDDIAVRPRKSMGEYLPILGLTVYWD